jgi:multidrug resistance efflux pump
VKTFVAIGVILIVVSIIGAKFALDHRSSASSNGKHAADGSAPPDHIVCWGKFDVEKGIAPLDPRQFGKVVEVAAENAQVKEGDVILRIDDRLAVLKVREAQEDVKASEQQLADAKNLPELYALQKKAQTAAVAAVDLEIKKTERDRDIKLDSLRDSSESLKKTTREFYDNAIGQLNEKKKAEEAKLEQVKLQNADRKITQAQADLDAKKSRLEQAKELVEYHKIKAPSDGTVLRVFVHEGETLGPNPMKHAIDFVPKAPIIVRAEVLQEWGRLIRDPGKNAGSAQEVEIQDDTFDGPKWQGKVLKVMSYYAPTRTPVIEPFRYNDVRTLECLISVDSGDTPKRIGQQVRAMIKTK